MSKLSDADKLMVSILKHEAEDIFLRIRGAWFDAVEHDKLNYITRYYRDNNELPGIRTFCKHFSLSDISEVDSKPSIYLNDVRERFIYTKIADEVPPLLRKAKGAPSETLKSLTEFVSDNNFGEFNSRDSYYSENTASRIEDYELRKRTGGVTYLSSGHSLWDKIFFGYQKNDLITFGGRAGSKKTWLIVYLVVLLDDYLCSLPDEEFEKYGDILFVTNEMSDTEIKERMDCIRFLLPIQDFLSGNLSERAENRYRSGLSRLKKRGSAVRLVYNCNTLNELEVKIRLYNPCAVFIDGSYLMEPQLEEGWQKIVYITRNLKGFTKQYNKPVINTTQLRRGSGKNEKQMYFEAQDEFAFGNSYVQDSDLAFRMFMDKHMVMQQIVGVQIAKGRRVGQNSGINFYAPMGSMDFDFLLPEDDEDAPVPEPELLSLSTLSA